MGVSRYLAAQWKGESSPGFGPDRQVVPCLTTEVMSEEQPTYGVEHAPAHLHHILHDLLDGCVGNGHVYGTDGDHEVEARDDISGVLHELVQIREMVPGLGVCVVEIVGEMTEGVKNRHVCHCCQTSKAEKREYAQSS